METISELQERAAAFLKQPTAVEGALGLAGGGVRFSEFLPEHVERAVEIAQQFMGVREAEGGEAGLRAVLEAAEQTASTEDTELVKHALMLFITHDHEGSRLPIPSLEERAPEKLVPSPRPEGLGLAGDPEADLDWYREDPLANAHHEHWHIVYPTGGVPDRFGNRRLKDRQGELFFYMHQQMLARYDTERLALGWQRVEAFKDYTDSMVGYTSVLPGFSSRPDNIQLSDVNRPDLGIDYTVANHEGLRDVIDNAVNQGFLETNTGTNLPINPSLLGATEEPTIGTASRGRYGNHHGFGHVLIALSHDPDGFSAPGVMWDTATAIRDPMFYRWHRHVDDFSREWQDAQPPNDFSDAPNVLVRKALNGDASAHQSPDIILAFTDSIPASGVVDPQTFGEATFGGASWDQDFSTGDVTTDELQTMMLERDIDVDGGTITIPYLDHRDFGYFLRVENLNAEETEVTVRIFLTAQEMSEERDMWIEMDKFRATLSPNARTVIWRPASLSAVIRKPAVRPPSPIAHSGTEPRDNYCDCGWPFNLLLPRGTHEGMPFRLMVMITDWNLDRLEDLHSCGSMSFCGARDRYPDRRGMGYPFDRPFAGSISDSFAAQDNIATRDFTIRWVP